MTAARPRPRPPRQREGARLRHQGRGRVRLRRRPHRPVARGHRDRRGPPLRPRGGPVPRRLRRGPPHLAPRRCSPTRTATRTRSATRRRSPARSRWATPSGPARATSAEMPTAFVTGGSGFVGGALIERLRREGWDVRALARSERAAERVRELGAEPVMGDLDDRDPAGRRRGLRGRLPRRREGRGLGRSRPTSSGSTCSGTQNVIDACRDGGRTAARARGHRGCADGRAAAGECGRERAAAAGLAGALLVVEGEGRAARARCDGDGLETVVVRPRFVWGRGDTTLLPQIIEMVARAASAGSAAGRQLTATTHIDNTVEGLWLGGDEGARRAASTS